MAREALHETIAIHRSRQHANRLRSLAMAGRQVPSPFVIESYIGSAENTHRINIS